MTTAGKGPDTSANRVFISYSNENHTDRQVAEMVYEALKSSGICCWVDHQDISPGQNWPDEIGKAITKSRVMIVVLSANTQKSRYVNREVTQAADENLTIIPFCLEKVSLHGGLRLLLSNCQWINAYPGPPAKYLGRLLESLPAYLGQEPGESVNREEKQLEVVNYAAKPKIKKQKLTLRQKRILTAVSMIIFLIAAALFINQWLSKKETTTGKLLQDIPKTNNSPVDPGKEEKTKEETQKETAKKTPEKRNAEIKGDDRKNQVDAKEKPEASIEKPGFIRVVEAKGAETIEVGQGSWEAHYKEYDITMVYIPPGKFMMGSNDGDDDESPPHEVYLGGYWIGKYEVTFAQYDRYCKETKKEKPGDRGWGREKRPVINVSWDDAAAYCKWLSAETGLEFKLPSEAQWEKAARGTDQRQYPWGNTSPSGIMANFADKQLWIKAEYSWAAKDIDDGYAYTAPVGSFPLGASPYGLPDMAGNVWEWCSDWYDGSYYKKSPGNNPTGPINGPDRVIRGGGWGSVAGGLRCANRGGDVPSSRGDYLGFRLCQD